MPVVVFAISDESYQPVGVGIYRTTQDIWEEVEKYWCEPGDDPNLVFKDFLSKGEWVEVTEFPPGGYLESAAALDAIKTRKVSL